MVGFWQRTGLFTGNPSNMPHPRSWVSTEGPREPRSPSRVIRGPEPRGQGQEEGPEEDSELRLSRRGPAGCPYPGPTARDDAFQTDDIGVVKLAHDGRLTQEVPPLPLCVASFEGLDGHRHVLLPRHPQPPIADFSRLPWTSQEGLVGEGSGALLLSPALPLSFSLPPGPPLHPGLPEPMIFSMWILEASISRVKPWPARPGSS